MEILTRFTDRRFPDQPMGSATPFSIDQYKKEFGYNSEEDAEILGFLWTTYGLGSFEKGLFWLIDPAEYIEYVKRFDNISNKALPFLRTALGNFLIWDFVDNQYKVMYLDVHRNEYTFRSSNFRQLFNIILSINDYFDEELNGEIERLAVKKFPDLEIDACVGFVPALALGGDENYESMQKVKLKEHLFLLSEIHKKA